MWSLCSLTFPQATACKALHSAATAKRPKSTNSHVMPVLAPRCTHSVGSQHPDNPISKCVPQPSQCHNLSNATEASAMESQATHTSVSPAPPFHHTTHFGTALCCNCKGLTAMLASGCTHSAVSMQLHILTSLYHSVPQPMQGNLYKTTENSAMDHRLPAPPFHRTTHRCTLVTPLIPCTNLGRRCVP